MKWLLRLLGWSPVIILAEPFDPKSVLWPACIGAVGSNKNADSKMLARMSAYWRRGERVSAYKAMIRKSLAERRQWIEACETGLKQLRRDEALLLKCLPRNERDGEGES